MVSLASVVKSQRHRASGPAALRMAGGGLILWYAKRDWVLTRIAE
jgi:hypothetical protein